jgi:hypothetical protein
MAFTVQKRRAVASDRIRKVCFVNVFDVMDFLRLLVDDLSAGVGRGVLITPSF